MFIPRNFKSNDFVSAYSKGFAEAFFVSAHSKGFASTRVRQGVTIFAFKATSEVNTMSTGNSSLPGLIDIKGSAKSRPEEAQPMRPMRSTFLLFVTFLISIPVVAQQPPQRDPQAIALLQRAYAALSGGQAISDVTLTGTARRVAGSDDETGTAILKALATGASRLDHSFPSGQRSEVRNTSANPPARSWSGPDR